MAKSREINMNLPSVDDLFTTQEERDQKNQEYVKDISIYEITDFPNHPFKVKMDDKMLETIESVRDHGVLVPALVREKSTGGYEMISIILSKAILCCLGKFCPHICKRQ